MPFAAALAIASALTAALPADAQVVRWRPEEVDQQILEGLPQNTAVIRIERLGFLESPAQVQLQVTGGTATRDVDFEFFDETFAFHPNLLEFDDTFTGVLIFDDDIEEPEETVRITMTISGGATLAGPATAIVRILDNDGPTIPTVEFDNQTLAFEDATGLWIFPLAAEPARSILQMTTPTPIPETIPVRTRGSLPTPATVRVTSNPIPIDAPGSGLLQFPAGAGTTRGFQLRQPQLPPDRAAFTALGLIPQSGGLEPGNPTTARAGYFNPSEVSPSCFLDHVLYCTGLLTRPPASGTCGAPMCGGSFGTAVRAGLASIPSARAVQLDDPLTDTLTLLADQVLAPSPAGRYYANGFASYGRDLLAAAFARPRLMIDAAEASGPWIDGFRRLAEGDGSDAMVTPAMVDDLEALIADTREVGGPSIAATLDRETARLNLDTFVGLSFDQAFQRLEQVGGPTTCTPGSQHLCLNEDRFRVEVAWTDFQGNHGPGRSRPLTDDTGAFWFFNPANVELVVKVLDGRPINGNYWVFYGSLSNVEYTLTVTDLQTGAIQSYRNPSGNFGSVGDTEAFVPASLASLPPAAATRLEIGLWDVVSSRMWGGFRDQVAGWGEVLARSLGGGSNRSEESSAALRRRDLQARLASSTPLATAGATIATGDLPTSTTEPLGGCVPDPTHLCLQGGRFRVGVEWTDFQGGTGVGHAESLSADSGTFWFFRDTNIELIVKVLDGRPVNGNYWVFYGALSNVEYRITVTDTLVDRTRVYENPAGAFGSRGDTEAFSG